MKKLLIAAAMVCATAFAQAATVNWAVSNVKNSAGTAPTAGWAVMAFYTAKDAGSDAIVSAIQSKTASTLAFESTTLITSFGSGKVNAHDGTATGITDTSKNYDFYFVVFNDSDATKATEYAMVSALNKEYSSLDAKFTAAGNFTGATWSDVPAPVIPEPTTGLLVLLGVAGLALRRRRA